LALELRDIRLTSIGGQAGERDVQWATLAVHLMNTDLEHGHTVDIKVLVPKRTDVTLGEMQEAAQQSAIHILQATIEFIESGPLSALETQINDRREAQAAELRARIGD
jgi:hypothetical protein